VTGSPSPPAFTANDVREYYDRNTRAFVRHGQGGDLGAIHRAVWGPGVRNRPSAFHYVEDQIAYLLRSLPDSGEPRHLVDLGCGVGASLCYLAEHLPIRGTGVTLSPVQARQGAARIAAAGLADRVRCIEGDYTALPADIGEADLAYAIESFVHGPSPERFLAEAARIVRPGGFLVVCDDVRRPTAEPGAPVRLEEFARGWHVNTLVTADALRGMAEAAGFAHVSTTDLTPYLELRRPRDRALAVVTSLAGLLGLRSRRLDPLLGGHALQTCLSRGWLAYDLAVFRRTIA
jgi:SAM-dependent methyltransferase